MKFQKAMTVGISLRFLPVLLLVAALNSCVGIDCLGSPFVLAFWVNGNPTNNDAAVQAPTTIRIGTSSQFEPTCGNVVVVNKVAFYWGSQLLAVDTIAPFEFVWAVQPGKDSVPLTGAATQVLYAVANDQYTSQRPKLTIQVTSALRNGERSNVSLVNFVPMLDGMGYIR